MPGGTFSPAGLCAAAVPLGGPLVVGAAPTVGCMVGKGHGMDALSLHQAY